MHPVDILKKAREILSDSRRWCKHESAVRENGARVDPLSLDACRWCATGALCKASGTYGSLELMDSIELLEAECCVQVVDFNDLPSTTHEDILRVFDQAILSAEGE